MKRFIIFAFLAFSACNTIPTPKPLPTTDSSILGLLSISIDLRDEANPVANATFNPLRSRNAQNRTIAGVLDTVVNIRRRQVQFLDINDLAPFGTPSRYVQATFEIANVGATPFSNLNLIATSFNKAGTNPTYGTSWAASKLGTMFNTVVSGAGVAVTDTDTFPNGANVFRAIKPSHGMRSSLRGVVVNPDLADMQIYTRTGNPATGEVDKVQADANTFYTDPSPSNPDSHADVLDYGFVARNFLGGRTIPTTAPTCAFTTDPTCYKGQFTLGFYLPRQPTRVGTPFVFAFQVLIAAETDSIATQSLEEQTDAKGSGRLQELISTLPNINPLINLLSGSGFYGSSTLNKRTLCDVRTATASGVFANPELLTTAPGVMMETVAPAPNSKNISATSGIAASFCQAMNAPTDSSFVVQAFQTGQRKVAGGTFNNGLYSGGGTTLSYTPTAPFKPGEEVEISLSSGLTRSSDSVAIKPVVYRFRNAASAEIAAGFGAVSNFATGTLPLSVVSGDFNQDGNLDLASANQGANTVSIMLGNGTGAFAAATSVAVGVTPTAISSGDFNNDGILDLATANQTAGTISVLIGNGTGGFTVTTYTVGTNPNSIATGDFNSDGKLDLVSTSDNIDGTVSVLYGTGAGVFATASSFSAGSNQSSVLSGDFNADGHLDVAVLLSHPTVAGEISVLFSDGAGNFLTPKLFSVANTPTMFASADFNNDGRLDFVTANNNVDTQISVLLSNNAGSYATSQAIILPAIPTAVSLGDLNGDGQLDVVVVNEDPTNNVNVLYGNNAGGFAAPLNLTVGTSPAGASIGDLNNDGRLDLVVANSGSNNVSVLLKQ
jgi:FG-GAP-like repeat/Bacterial Ig-like domain